LLASRRGLLTIVAVVVAMYPASTVVLATVLDGERMRRPQLLGLTIAAVALVFVTIGR
jgi:drug/metabolite transporter (DMT)-like permease